MLLEAGERPQRKLLHIQSEQFVPPEADHIVTQQHNIFNYNIPAHVSFLTSYHSTPNEPTPNIPENTSRDQHTAGCAVYICRIV